MNQEIIVVSGLPRSGTSLMMQLLERAGMEVVTDRQRTADDDNPRGYYEFEAVKNLPQDAKWISEARGKAVKIVSLLLYHLPPTEQYRVIFMERNLEEILPSQEAMLKRLKRIPAPREQMQEAYRVHLENLAGWLASRPEMSVLRVGYKDLVEQTESQVNRLSEFLGRTFDANLMIEVVDPALYRNRNQNDRR